MLNLGSIEVLQAELTMGREALIAAFLELEKARMTKIEKLIPNYE